jgi:hypothetical protein
MKKFFNVLIFACVGFAMQGCYTNESNNDTESTGFVEVDPSSVASADTAPKTLAMALEADDDNALLLAEATAVKKDFVLDSWYTSDERDDSGNRMRIVDCTRSEIFKIKTNQLVSTKGQVVMCNETLIFNNDKTSEELQQDFACQIEYPDGSKFTFPAYASKGRLFVTNKDHTLTDLMKTYKESTLFIFVNGDGTELHSFKVPSKGL